MGASGGYFYIFGARSGSHRDFDIWVSPLETGRENFVNSTNQEERGVVNSNRYDVFIYFMSPVICLNIYITPTARHFPHIWGSSVGFGINKHTRNNQTSTSDAA